MESNVKVVCRFRPLSSKGKEDFDSLYSSTSSLSINKLNATLELDQQSSSEPQILLEFKNIKSAPQLFAYDKIFWEHSNQEEIYDAAVRPIVNDVIEGFNGTVLAFGQGTSSGKTYSMIGDLNTPELQGTIPRALHHLFTHADNEKGKVEIAIQVSFVEIYKEAIKDLLKPKNTNLKLRQNAERGVWVEGITQQPLESYSHGLEILKSVTKYRDKNPNKSHFIMFVNITQKYLSDQSVRMSKLCLADLAGSERAAKSTESLEESKKVNHSLLVLGSCINALSKAGKVHIPYRDSKLSHILKESLGGNSKTSIIICCVNHTYCMDETVSTLQFGVRARSIKNKVSRNTRKTKEDLTSVVNRLMAENDSLHAMVRKLKDHIQTLESKSNENAGTFLQEISQELQQLDEEEEVEDTLDNSVEVLNAVEEEPLPLQNIHEQCEIQITDITEKLNTANTRISELESLIEKMNQDAKEKEAQHERSVTELSREFSIKQQEYETRLEQLQSQLDETKSQFEKCKQELDLKSELFEKDLDSANSQNSLLQEEVELAWNAYQDAVQKLNLTKSLLHSNQKEISGSVVATVTKSSSFSDFFESLSAKKGLPKKDKILQNAVKEGWLTKQGGVVRSWQRRYCVLKDNLLFYFKAQEDDTPKGCIPLRGCTVKDASADTKHQFSFGIYQTAQSAEKRTFFLYTETEEELHSWMKAFASVPSIKIDEKLGLPALNQGLANVLMNQVFKNIEEEDKEGTQARSKYGSRVKTMYIQKNTLTNSNDDTLQETSAKRQVKPDPFDKRKTMS